MKLGSNQVRAESMKREKERCESTARALDYGNRKKYWQKKKTEEGKKRKNTVDLEQTRHNWRMLSSVDINIYIL